ncbi:hypothetical protein C7974DRAFT_411781 [Boeremia exigua]|uniref:uncharacterized protein n=1 Tax=Boeremia exigua TaxID=749465 RepID=UPI001E8CA0A0|nr:uncharacterized protein C7974DRAFT_411781 [Boeremia exigua]KAH6638354.1 hypothetical protein C7974DRAFT_411781 [Boeremia exigua]
MKLTTILSTCALLASAIASTVHPNIHAVADLIARDVDLATMDPTKLSILSVLKTAMPTPTGTDTEIALPTGDVAPQWYKDLPADVMVLLAQMYPATSSVAVGTSSETAIVSPSTSSPSMQEVSSMSATQTTLTRTLELVPTVTAVSNGSLSTGSSSATLANGTLTTGSPSPTQSSVSTGAKNTVDIKLWSLVMGLSIAVLFFLVA